MNAYFAEMASVGTHLIAILIAAVVVRHRLLEVAQALAEIVAQWAKNREIGQNRDKLFETLGGKVDENTREQRAGFERLEQRSIAQDAKIAALEVGLAGALSEITALKIHVSTLGAKS